MEELFEQYMKEMGDWEHYCKMNPKDQKCAKHSTMNTTAFQIFVFNKRMLELKQEVINELALTRMKLIKVIKQEIGYGRD